MGKPDSTKVSVLEGKVTGAIFVAPTSVPLPTDATTPLPEQYKCVGFTSEDGIVITEDGSTKSIRAWEGRTIVRNQRTEYKEQVKFTPIECNEDVAKLTWGENHVKVSASGALEIQHHGDTLEPNHTVIEAVPFAGAVSRYCSKTQLAERGDQTANGEDNAGRELTFDCLGVDGVTMTEYVAFTDAADEASADEQNEQASNYSYTPSYGEE